MTLDSKKSLARGGNSHSLKFDGNNGGYITDDSTLDTTNSISVSAWVKIDNMSSPSVLHMLISKARGSGFWSDNGYVFNIETDGSVRLQIRNNGDSWDLQTSSGILNESTWYHVVGTFNGSTQKIYINGSENISETQGSLGDNDVNAGLGCYTDGTNLFKPDKYGLVGHIAGAGIYSRALTSNEITKLYKGVSISRAGLVGEWKMNKGTGDTAYDSSGNGNNGTLVNSPTWSTDTPTYGG